MASEHLAKKQKFGLSLQTNWATTGDNTTAYETMFYDAANTTPGLGVTDEQFEFSSAKGLMPEKNRDNIDTKGIKELPFQMKLDRENLAHHLAAAFQSVSEGATAPYLKTVVPVNDVVDFNGDEGYVYSLAMGNYDNGADAGDGIVYKQAILNDFSIEFNNQVNGVGKAAVGSGTWFATQVDTDEYLSGTWTNTAAPSNILGLESTAAYALSLAWDSETYSNICWHRFMLSINNNIEGTCRGTGGVITQWRLGTPELTFEIDIPKNENTYKLIGDYANGVYGSFDFARGDGTAAGEFVVDPTALMCKMTASPLQYSNGYEVIRISGSILADSSGNFSGLIKFADGTDRSF